jgi:hypothetical protein
MSPVPYVVLRTQAIEAGKSAGDAELHILYSNRSASYLLLGRASDALSDANKCIEAGGPLDSHPVCLSP